MSAARLPIIILPGASGHAPDCAPFCADPSERDRFVALGYPSWEGYAEGGLTGEALIAALAADISHHIPQGPVGLLGVSIGGHFAYATALRLESLGCAVAGVCIIDAGAIAVARSTHWKARLISNATDLLRRGRPGEVLSLIRHLAWRGLFRLAGDSLPRLARDHVARLSRIGKADPVFAEELSMRLLIRITAAWMPSLDDQAADLRAPAVLLRTSASVSNDALWRLRCSNLRIIEIPGNHETMFEAENVAALRSAFLAGTAAWGAPGESGRQGNVRSARSAAR